jgi:glyoxylase-like metal-dependent hydrolase (beta-lactamase superfamily II)
MGGTQAGDLTFTSLNDQITLFNNGKVQSLVISGNSESVLIDPINKSNTEEIKNYLRENNKPSITNIIYSHSHWDRLLGSTLFDTKKHKIISQSACELYFTRNNNTDITKPNFYFKKQHTISLEEEEIVLHYFGPSHGECMVIIEMVRAKILFVPELISTRGASFPKDPTLPFLRPATLENFFTRLEELVEEKKIQSFISGYGDDETYGSVKIISEQKQFWQLILITAKEAEEDGLVDLNNFIDVEKLDLEPFSEYDNFNKADLVNILRRYTSFLNMGR